MEEQSAMAINLGIIDKAPEAGQALMQMQIKVPKELQEPTEEESPAPETKGEHFMPHLMKYILENQLGILPYKVQENIRHYDMRRRIAVIDDHRIELANQAKTKVPKAMKRQL